MLGGGHEGECTAEYRAGHFISPCNENAQTFPRLHFKPFERLAGLCPPINLTNACSLQPRSLRCLPRYGPFPLT